MKSSLLALLAASLLAGPLAAQSALAQPKQTPQAKPPASRPVMAQQSAAQPAAAKPAAAKPTAATSAAAKPTAQPTTGQPSAKPTTASASTAQPAAAKPAAAKPTAAPATTAATTTKPTATPAAKPGPTPPTARTARDSGARSASVAQRSPVNEVTFSREVFSYERGGRRDPFVSLLSSGELRPIFNDLKLVAVAYDPTGRNSVAVMRDITTKDQYRVKVGQTLGRMRVNQIQPKSVSFTIEEFGYSRQEVLALGDSTKARNP